ncbi:N-acetylmuramoyl-L-alanine amidase [Candidatus Woesearchaeota archaeon]|nr:N-acetylmuramoyl-L-alanine amidase [Candidatus Woesearchaeota archaeon]
MNKKGDTTILKEAIYVVIGAIGLLLVFLIFKPLIMGVLFDIPDQNSINNFERLVKEVRLSFKEYSGWDENDLVRVMTSYMQEVPISIDERLGIKFYNPDSEKRPSSCGKQDRPCMCLSYVEDFIDGKKPYKCESFKEGVDFIFDINYESFDGNSGDLGGLLVGSGIGSYVLSFSNYNVLAIAPHLGKTNVLGYNYADFTPDSPLVDVVDSTFQGEGESIHSRNGHKIDRLVLHYSVTYCGTNLMGEYACPGSTSAILRMRGLSIHYSVGTVNANGEYLDTIVTQSTPESVRAFHAGCIPSVEKCNAWCSSNDIPFEEWMVGRGLCNDLTAQKSELTRDSYVDINDRSIGIEITNLGFSYLTKEECDSRGGVYIAPQNGILSWYSGNVLISKPMSAVCWWPYSDELIDKLAKLVTGILNRNPDIKFDYDHIIAHEEIAYNKQDPGPLFPWEKFMQKVADELGTTAPGRENICPLSNLGNPKNPNNFVQNTCASSYILRTPAMDAEVS